MSKQKRAKLTASITREKTILHKPLVQIEGELSQSQLEAISKRSAERQRAAGALSLN